MTYRSGFDAAEPNNEARERVLAAAQQLFTERGYKAVTMQDIARELGMRQASLYYHAPQGKEQLFVEVARRTFEHHGRGLQAAIAGSEPDLEAQLTAAAGWFAGQPPMNLLGMMHADMPALSPENTAHLSHTAFRCLFEPLTRIFQAAQDRGETRVVSPDLLAGSFLALMDGIAISSANQPGTPPRAVMAADIIALLMDGLRPR